MPIKGLATIEKYKMLDMGDHIVVGLSGGADSVTLLHVLLGCGEKYNLTITAVHVNHCLRGAQADADERFAAELCERLGVPIRIFHYDISRIATDMKISHEEAGREMRYRAFSETQQLVRAQKIAVGHNKNDNAETILMRIFRGTGLKGICGIPPMRGDIIRPLIEDSRDEIENYLKSEGISYVTDQTNYEEIYTRNKIRLRILPLIQSETGCDIVEYLSRGSEIAREEEAYLDDTARDAFLQCVRDSEEGETALDAATLLEYPDAIKRRVIRQACVNLVNISSTHIKDIMTLLSKETGKTINLPHGLYVRCEYGSLIFSVKKSGDGSYCHYLQPGKYIYIEEIKKYVLARFEAEDIPVRDNLKCLCTKEINYDRIKNGLQIRTRRPGDRISISKVGTKKISDYFVDIKLPRHKRDRVPLITDGSDIVWILDEKAITNHIYRATCGARRIILQIWGENDEGNCE